jgi:hypothetical protein
MMAKLLLLLALVAAAWLWWRRHSLFPAKMPPAEARALLGIGLGATAQEVREAHRRLIARVHPDTGGSAELATRVNAARDALLADLKSSGKRLK